MVSNSGIGGNSWNAVLGGCRKDEGNATYKTGCMVQSSANGYYKPD